MQLKKTKLLTKKKHKYSIDANNSLLNHNKYQQLNKNRKSNNLTQLKHSYFVQHKDIKLKQKKEKKKKKRRNL